MLKKLNLIFNKKLLESAIKNNVSAAIEEDLKDNDKTSDILPAKIKGIAKIKQNKMQSFVVLHG